MNQKKQLFGNNADFEKDLETLDEIKQKINSISTKISSLNIRKSLIEEVIESLNKEISNIDVHQLKTLYDEVKINLSEVTKSFEELVTYHNKMIDEKLKFISSELPDLKLKLNTKQKELDLFLKQEEESTSKIEKYDSFSTLEDIIADLNEAHRQKGEYETLINQLSAVENNIVQYTSDFQKISKGIFSNDLKKDLESKLESFNNLFSYVSKELYGESYLLTYEIAEYRGKNLYKFSSYNMNQSS